MLNNRVKLLVTDWAGTIVDAGCFGPLIPIQKAFGKFGVHVSFDDIRKGGMGRSKIDNIQGIINLPHINTNMIYLDFISKNNLADLIYNEYVKFQKSNFISKPVNHAIPILNQLKSNNIIIGSDTGYNRSTIDNIAKEAGRQGLHVNQIVSFEDIPSHKGRPHPHTILKNIELAGIDNPKHVIKFGDTTDDITSGHNAKVWTISVIKTCSNMEMNEEEVDKLSPADKSKHYHRCIAAIMTAKPHYIIEDITKLPYFVHLINRRIEKGDTP